MGRDRTGMARNIERARPDEGSAQIAAEICCKTGFRPRQLVTKSCFATTCAKELWATKTLVSLAHS
jgi:hypothetical protein